ncbi:hypothetical protein HDV00_006954 [Rhizophlyctis rosea]|nr:hypothetical protein HDV00_006954 [Rhizophlyctis rosea]
MTRTTNDLFATPHPTTLPILDFPFPTDARPQTTFFRTPPSGIDASLLKPLDQYDKPQCRTNLENQLPTPIENSPEPLSAALFRRLAHPPDSDAETESESESAEPGGGGNGFPSSALGMESPSFGGQQRYGQGDEGQGKAGKIRFRYYSSKNAQKAAGSSVLSSALIPTSTAESPRIDGSNNSGDKTIHPFDALQWELSISMSTSCATYGFTTESAHTTDPVEFETAVLSYLSTLPSSNPNNPNNHTPTDTLTIDKLPCLDRRRLNLWALFHAVLEHGGSAHVTKHRKWKRVASLLGLPDTLTSASFTLRTYFQQFLGGFEEIFFIANPGIWREVEGRNLREEEGKAERGKRRRRERERGGRGGCGGASGVGGGSAFGGLVGVEGVKREDEVDMEVDDDGGEGESGRGEIVGVGSIGGWGAAGGRNGSSSGNVDVGDLVEKLKMYLQEEDGGVATWE